MSNKFKYPPQKPTKPYLYTPMEPREFYDAPRKELGRYSDGLTLSDIELPVGVSLTDLFFNAEIERGGYDDCPVLVVSYSTGEQVKNKQYDKEVKAREKQIEENKQKEAIYKEQMAYYEKAKAEYDAFWAKVEKQ